MTEKMSTFTGKMGLCLVILAAASAVYSQDKPFTIAVRGGVAVPHHWMLQGWRSVSYEAGGAPTDVNISGFGDGGEVVLSVSYTSPDGSAWLVELGAVFTASSWKEPGPFPTWAPGWAFTAPTGIP